MSWESWSKADDRGLARYVTPEAAQLLALPVSRLDLLRQQDGRFQLTQVIYTALIGQGIRYAHEKFSWIDTEQQIRTPHEILVAPKEGTCLDLAVLFCGLCLASDLLPLLIVLEGHALVAVSLYHGQAQFEAAERVEQYRFVNGLLTDGSVLHDLVINRLYRAIECTGFAYMTSPLTMVPESMGRDNGVLSFSRAVQAGEEQLTYPDRPFRFALDIAALRHRWSFRPLPLSGEAQRTEVVSTPTLSLFHRRRLELEYADLQLHWEQFSVKRSRLLAAYAAAFDEAIRIKYEYDIEQINIRLAHVATELEAIEKQLDQ